MKDAEVLILKALKTAGAKQKYLLHQLKAHWADVVGNAAAKHTQPYKIERRVLYVHTDYPLWSQTLLTSKGLYMGKVNQLLALKGTEYTIKDLKAFHGVLEEAPGSSERDEELFMPKRDDDRLCPLCGAPLVGNEKVCIFCRQKQEEQVRKSLAKQLQEVPWLTYEDCRKLVNCDKITFTDVKSALVERAMEKALSAGASEQDKAFAVMLKRNIAPQNIDDTMIKKVLQEEKRSRCDVPSRRK